MLVLSLVAAVLAESTPTAVAPSLTADVVLVVQPDGSVLADRQLPSGKSFTVGVADPALLGGALAVWRAAEDGTCTKADTAASGYQRVALVATSGGVTATLAALASGVPACLGVDAYRAAPAGLWEAYRVQIARETRAALTGGGATCTVREIRGKLDAAGGAATRSLPPHLQVNPAVIASRLAGATGATMRACEAYNLAFALQAGSGGAPTPGAPLLAATTRADALPPVLVGGVYVTFQQALATGKQAELEAAANALTPLVTAPTAPARSWQAHLRAAAAGTERPRAAPTAAAPVLLGKGGTYLPWTDYLRDHSLVDATTLAAQAAASFGTAVTPRPDPFAAVQETKAFVGALAAHAAQAPARQKALADAESALTQAVYDALDPARAPVATESVQLATTGVTALPQEAQKSGSYFSPAFGVGGAVAFGGTAPGGWAMPYVGVDIYLAPIDRNLPVGDLDGLPFRRWGLTVALAAYAPVQEVPNRLEEGLLPDVTMLLGVTHRIGRFTNVTGFVVPYKVAPDNPLAEPWRLSAAAGVAVSFDADVWAGVKTALPKL